MKIVTKQLLRNIFISNIHYITITITISCIFSLTDFHYFFSLTTSCIILHHNVWKCPVLLEIDGIACKHKSTKLIKAFEIFKIVA